MFIIINALCTLNVLSIYANDRKFVGENVHGEITFYGSPFNTCYVIKFYSQIFYDIDTRQKTKVVCTHFPGNKKT